MAEIFARRFDAGIDDGHGLDLRMTGTGWTCAVSTYTCTPSDVLNAGASYPAITVTVNVGSGASSPLVKSVSVSGGGSATANATDSTIVQAAGAVVSAVSVTPSSGLGVQQIFALEYADPLEATDLTSVWVWFTSNYNTVSAADSCMVYYARATNQLFFLNDAATVWSPATPGAAVTLSNSQCSINVAAASVTSAGTNLTMNLPVTFTAAYAGAKGTYMYAAGSSADSGWQLMGSWDVPATLGLSVGSTHSGSFVQGQTGATYTVTVSNTPGTATSGTVTVTDTLPSGLTLFSMAGMGWSCSANACTRTDSLAGGASYPAITVTVNVGANAASPQVNTVSLVRVSSSGTTTASGADQTTIVVPTGPTTVSVTPGGGTGAQQTFALQYVDPAGTADWTTVWVWITSNYNTASAANSCMLYYTKATNQLYFLNDAGTAWSSPVAPGAAVTLSNSSCSVNVGAASVTASGTDLILNLPVAFTAAYAGVKSIYMYAAGSSGASGWQNMGSWTVAAPPAVLTVQPPPFTLSITQSPQSVQEGQSATFTISALGSPGFTGQIALGWYNPPLTSFQCAAGQQVTFFNVSSLTPIYAGQQEAAILVTSNVAHLTQALPCNFAVSGTSGGVQYIAYGELDVTPVAAFTLTLNQPGGAPSVAPPSSGTVPAYYPINVTTQNGYSGIITFTAAFTGAPQGVPQGVAFSAIAQVAVSNGGSGSTTVTAIVPPGVAAGTYGLTITGTDANGIAHSVNGTLDIQTGAGYTLSVSPAQNIQQGQSASYTISMAPAGTGFNGTVTLNMGAITGGVTGSLSTTVISAGSPATLTLIAGSNASLGTYPILVNGIATTGTITHSVLARLTVNLGSSPGTTIQLGSISVQVGSATTPATIPPTIIVPPLPAGDSLTGCTGSPGTTAMLGTLPGSTTVQTLTLSATAAVQSGTAGSFSCTTGQGRIVAAVEEYWNLAQVEVNAIPQGGGSFQIQATTNGFSEVDDVSLTGPDGTGGDDNEGGTGGDVTAYFEIFLPAGCVIDRVVALGFGGDVDGGPAYADGSIEVCYEPGPPVAPYTISGQVTLGGSALPGVTVNLSGGLTASAVTDSNGNYSFNVIALALYVVAPSKSNCVFMPAQASFDLAANPGDQTANFAAITMSGLQAVQPATPNAKQNATDGSAPPAVTPFSSANTSSAFATASTPASSLMVVLINSRTVTVSAQNAQPSIAWGQVQWELDRDPATLGVRPFHS